MADEQPLQAQMSASSHLSLPLRKAVSARGSENSATGWI